MKKGLWKRRAFAFLVAAAMVIPQGVYAADLEGNEVPENVITEEVPERVHETGCILTPDHEGDCVTAPVEGTEEEQPEREHEEGCTLAPDHEGPCVTAPAENTEEEQPEREHEVGCVLPSDHEGECKVEEQEEAMLLKAPRAGEIIYVCDEGTGDGSEDNPFGSLKAAIDAANASTSTEITI